MVWLCAYDASAGQPFDPGPEVQVFAFYFLGVPLAGLMPAGIQVASISPPVIREVTANIERGKQRFQVLENRVPAFAKHISQHGVGTLKGTCTLKGINDL